jgi:hypothetical protein
LSELEPTEVKQLLPPSLESVNCFEPMNNMEDLLVNLKLKREFDVPQRPTLPAKQVSWNMECESDKEGKGVKEGGKVDGGKEERESMMKIIEDLTKRIEDLEKAIQLHFRDSPK